MTPDEINDLMAKCRCEAGAKRDEIIKLTIGAKWPSDGNKLMELADEMNEFLLDEFQFGLAEVIADHAEGKHLNPCEHPACDIPLSELKEMDERLYDRWGVHVL